MRPQGARILEPHSRAEGELLYGALGGDRRSGPLATVHDEHEEIGETLAAVDRVSDVHTAAELLREAVWMTREHCWREEEVAFPLAERVLGDETLSRLGLAWAERRDPQPA